MATAFGLATILLTYLIADGQATVFSFLTSLVANLMIWFPDPIGNSTGYMLTRLTRPTPEIIVRIAGWVLLILPATMLALKAWLARSAV